MTLPELERVLRDAMDRAISDGWTIARGITVDQGKRACCAMGAVRVAGANVAFFLDYDRGNGITSGFDGGWCFGVDDDYYALGQRLAREYVDGIKP